MKPAHLEAAIWLMIYGGLLLLVVGLALTRADAELTAPFILVGGGLTVIGAILIWVRSRMDR